MSILFEPMVIKGMELKNRFVRSATYDGYADHTGQVTDNQIQFFKDLARGGEIGRASCRERVFTAV